MSTSPEPLVFPPDFLWGTATAAHQIEGGNINSDWWVFENKGDSSVAEPSGDACDSYNRWEADLDLVASMGLQSYRFSIEWSRIEPEEGRYSFAERDHYLQICKGARARGLLPVVTFHHFTSPRWFAERGGFEWSEAPERFARYVSFVAETLGPEIALACTINEPNIVAFMGYGFGAFPPGIVNDFERVRSVNATLLEAHHQAVTALRNAPGVFPIGLTLSMAELIALDGGEAARDDFQEMMEDCYLRELQDDDFIGVQCYTRFFFNHGGLSLGSPGTRTTPMGYEFWPNCVEATVRRAAAMTGLPIVVTENGVSTTNDQERIEYLDGALRSLHRVLREGVDVRGYFCWSLLDNFEWAFGYQQHFGLVSVDRRTFVRTPKPSADFYGSVAKSRTLGGAPRWRESS